MHCPHCSLQQNLMRGLIPNLIVALKHLIKANEVDALKCLSTFNQNSVKERMFRFNDSLLPCLEQDQASEAMEVFNELLESEVYSVIIPHFADIIGFCLEVRAAVESPPPPHFD